LSLKKEYISSLKGTEVEEIIDLIIYRPLSFLFVKAIYPTNITPNQLSIFAMFLSVVAGVLYGYGTSYYYTLAAIVIFISNTIDCADGQLARMKKNGTKIGRIIDGAIDYVSVASVLIGAGISLSQDPKFGNAIWVLIAIAGISRAFQNMFFDYYRNLYMRFVYDSESEYKNAKISPIDYEIELYKRDLRMMNRTKGRLMEKFLISLYINYSIIQSKITKHFFLDVTPEEYKKKNKTLLRIWSWLGSTTHLTAYIIFSLFFRLEIYFIITIAAGNLLMFVMLIFQKSVINELKNKPLAGKL
jgi:hypothetical protein